MTSVYIIKHNRSENLLVRYVIKQCLHNSLFFVINTVSSDFSNCKSQERGDFNKLLRKSQSQTRFWLFYSWLYLVRPDPCFLLYENQLCSWAEMVSLHFSWFFIDLALQVKKYNHKLLKTMYWTEFWVSSDFEIICCISGKLIHLWLTK